MYSYQDRIKAVNLHIKHDLHSVATVRESGYPTRTSYERFDSFYIHFLDTGKFTKFKYPVELK